MPDCDEDGCPNLAEASCDNCAVMLCLDHCGGEGADCDECGSGTMHGL